MLYRYNTQYSDICTIEMRKIPSAGLKEKVPTTYVINRGNEG